jgi:hypothetical protein
MASSIVIMREPTEKQSLVSWTIIPQFKQAGAPVKGLRIRRSVSDHQDIVQAEAATCPRASWRAALRTNQESPILSTNSGDHDEGGRGLSR